MLGFTAEIEFISVEFVGDRGGYIQFQCALVDDGVYSLFLRYLKIFREGEKKWRLSFFGGQDDDF